ncbi:hypothetical protein Nepgr_016422 [Nepenthes gracilis]|uniref:Uncharacterized protein n=1 Tax=Nepenthes gracilis TaxID=150966 RepID=A0AAD3XSA3_NEPGR|nr:hypothetical protein Nepgr_016422 [Nepenthes gracilis]
MENNPFRHMPPLPGGTGANQGLESPHFEPLAVRPLWLWPHYGSSSGSSVFVVDWASPLCLTGLSAPGPGFLASFSSVFPPVGRVGGCCAAQAWIYWASVELQMAEFSLACSLMVLVPGTVLGCWLDDPQPMCSLLLVGLGVAHTVQAGGFLAVEDLVMLFGLALSVVALAGELVLMLLWWYGLDTDADLQQFERMLIAVAFVGSLADATIGAATCLPLCANDVAAIAGGGSKDLLPVIWHADVGVLHPPCWLSTVLAMLRRCRWRVHLVLGGAGLFWFLWPLLKSPLKKAIFVIACLGWSSSLWKVAVSWYISIALQSAPLLRVGAGGSGSLTAACCALALGFCCC